MMKDRKTFLLWCSKFNALRLTVFDVIFSDVTVSLEQTKMSRMLRKVTRKSYLVGVAGKQHLVSHLPVMVNT